MKSKTTVFLIVALVACVAYVAIRRGGLLDKPAGNDPSDGAGALLRTAPGRPMELTVASQTGRRMKFRSRAGRWSIVEPINAAAIDERIITLADAITSITCIQRYKPEDPKAPDATVTGLDSPRWTVTLVDDKQKTCSLQIGGYVPLSGKTRTYVRLVGGDEISVAQGDLAETMSQPVSYYRNTRVLEIPTKRVMAVRIAGAETYSIHRDKPDEWLIKSGPEYKTQFSADPQEVQVYLQQLARIDARRFIDDNPKSLTPYGLDPGARRLAVTVVFIPEGSEDAESRTLSLGLQTTQSGRDEVFAKLTDHPTVFTLPASMLAGLQSGTLALRDKTIIPIVADSVTAIELDLEVGGKMKLVKAGDKWSVASDSPTGANPERVALILNRIATLKAIGFRSEKATEVEFGFDKPRGEIRLFENGTAKPKTLTIGSDSPAGAVAFVKSNIDNVVASVGASEVRVFLAPVVRYHDPTIWSLPAQAEVNRIVLSRSGGESELTAQGGGKWRLVKPIDAPVDTENVNSILDRLDNLTATRIVSVGRKTRAYYERGARPVAVTFGLGIQGPAASRPAGKTRTFKMSIIDGKVYGWMTGDPLGRVGLFTGKLYKQFTAEVRRRKVIDFDPNSITEIALTSGGKPMVLKKLDSGWKYPADLNLNINQSAVKAYLNHIKSFRAIRFVDHAEKPDAKFGLQKTKVWLALDLTTSDKKTIGISVSRKGSDETTNRYAAVSGLRGVFTISAETAAGLAGKIENFRTLAIPTR